MNSIEEAQEREKEARRHGRHIKLEQELNAIGLSLFAPPFSDFRPIQGNEWEGHFMPEEIPTKSQAAIDALSRIILEIDKAFTEPVQVQVKCAEAIQKLMELAVYSKKQAEAIQKLLQCL